MNVDLRQGDSKVILGDFPDNFFDSAICDPPYHLVSIQKRFSSKTAAPAKKGKDGRFQRLSKGFMGQEWDGGDIAFDRAFWAEVLRVLKPGGHLLSFGGPRTYHRMAVAVEDAGFIIRDMIAWIYGQGFPKSHDLGEGWGTGLKPAQEPIALAQKPISERSVIANFKRWGTGGLFIEGSRIEANGEIIPINRLEEWSGFGQKVRPEYTQETNTKGRWPGNVILDEEAGALLDRQSGVSKSNGGHGEKSHGALGKNVYNKFALDRLGENAGGLGDVGGASRFFYCAKTGKEEKNLGLEEKNPHPTVKPISLMRYLIKLVTPSGGAVLDPFMGSGSTGCAAGLEDVGSFTGIDLTPAYLPIAQARIAYWLSQRPPMLDLFQDAAQQ